ncbi:MAG: hypothetical protein Q9184_007182, partial [Pyrenodesmia sp. 2 TL-2023]
KMPSISYEAERPMPSLYPILGSSSNIKDIAVNIVFGIFAVAASLLTLWQAHRLWQTMRHGAARGQEARGREARDPGHGTSSHDVLASMSSNVWV